MLHTYEEEDTYMFIFICNSFGSAGKAHTPILIHTYRKVCVGEGVQTQIHMGSNTNTHTHI
jgi:hypothetical protein